MSFPDFRGNLVEGVDIAMPTVTFVKFSALFVWFIHNTPNWLLKIASPRLGGVVLFRQVGFQMTIQLPSKINFNLLQTLEDQIKSVLKNPQQLNDTPHRILYGELLNPENNKGRSTPTATHLRHEAQLMFAAGSHTVGTTLMIGVYHLLHNPDSKQRLVDEVRNAWPVLDQPPPYEDLEKLPFLASSFTLITRAELNNETGCRHQRGVASRHTYSRWPSTRRAIPWCRNFRR
jgi:hypothetical protein